MPREDYVRLMNLHGVLTIQAIYYFITAIWPIAHIKSFEWVSGEKKEDWLVYTVSTLLLGSTAVFAYAVMYRDAIPMEVIILSGLNCLGLTLIDVIFVSKKIIRSVYLLDALVEILILGALIFLAIRAP